MRIIIAALIAIAVAADNSWAQQQQSGLLIVRNGSPIGSHPSTIALPQ